MKMIVDLVVNHTSDEHVWFAESRKSEQEPTATTIFGEPKRMAKNRITGFRFFSGSAWKKDASGVNIISTCLPKSGPI